MIEWVAKEDQSTLSFLFWCFQRGPEGRHVLVFHDGGSDWVPVKEGVVTPETLRLSFENADALAKEIVKVLPFEEARAEQREDYLHERKRVDMLLGNLLSAREG